jgi:Pyruvate/2-oxoacid:ferredoxin oxidoreductase delta subunit
MQLKESHKTCINRIILLTKKKKKKQNNIKWTKMDVGSVRVNGNTCKGCGAGMEEGPH